MEANDVLAFLGRTLLCGDLIHGSGFVVDNEYLEWWRLIEELPF